MKAKLLKEWDVSFWNDNSTRHFKYLELEEPLVFKGCEVSPTKFVALVDTPGEVQQLVPTLKQVWGEPHWGYSEKKEHIFTFMDHAIPAPEIKIMANEDSAQKMRIAIASNDGKIIVKEIPASALDEMMEPSLLIWEKPGYPTRYFVFGDGYLPDSGNPEAPNMPVFVECSAKKVSWD